MIFDMEFDAFMIEIITLNVLRHRREIFLEQL